MDIPDLGVANLKRKVGDSLWVSNPVPDGSSQRQKRARRSGDSHVASEQMSFRRREDPAPPFETLTFRRREDPAPPFETLTTDMGVKLCNRLVRIMKTEPVPIHERTIPGEAEVYVTSYTGTILQSEENFCYILTHEQAPCDWLEDTTIKVQFFDGAEKFVKQSDFKTVQGCQYAILCCVMDRQLKGGDIGKMEFGARVSRNQKVFLLGYDPPDKPFCTEGHVNVSEDDIFTHDCGPGVYSHLGGSVFNEAGQLVGLSIYHNGAVDAYHAAWIPQSLSELHEGLEEFEDIFQQAKTEALSRAEAEKDRGLVPHQI